MEQKKGRGGKGKQMKTLAHYGGFATGGGGNAPSEAKIFCSGAKLPRKGKAAARRGKKTGKGAK